MDTPTKRCSKCGLILPLTEFHPSKSCKDGHRNTCKKCRSLVCAEWTKKHPEHARKIKSEWTEKNYDHKRELDRQWRESHKEHTKRIHREHYRANRDRILERQHQQYRKAHPIPRQKTDPLKKRTLKKMAKHRYRARLRSCISSFTYDDWASCLDYWHDCCAYCGSQQGFDNPITADHWIPLNSLDCPGTTPLNMLPACRACNSSKSDNEPIMWLNRKFGNRKAKMILNKIMEYFKNLSQEDHF